MLSPAVQAIATALLNRSKNKEKRQLQTKQLLSLCDEDDLFSTDMSGLDLQ